LLLNFKDIFHPARRKSKGEKEILFKEFVNVRFHGNPLQKNLSTQL
jgi:hypothetical protein